MTPIDFIFLFMIRVDPSTILFYFNFFIRSESIRPGLAVRVDLASQAGVFRGARFSSLPCGE